ncbi:MAG: hypothetical protein A4E73_02601 [Syntrophaceae bacterium PtaU1.Bin231]|nr:MAG: hypothetical protein A4E73_02601 [Syntrophaceae bacterium PtaU1.Bin231]
MKQHRVWQIVWIGFFALCLALPAPLFAQQAPAKVFKQEELEQLLAPIALYPDDVLAPILMASTYPLEVVQAERWAKKNKSLKGDAMKAALEQQTWDNSVKSLVAFPDVLTMMSEKLDWTQKLGDAFLAQEKDVMDTVQKLRRKASEAGNLKSSSELTVKKEAEIIIIEPANPQVVYVPAYNPSVVYGVWAYPAYPPYPVYAYPPGAGMFTFAMGVAVGSAWYHGWGNCNWNGGTVNINKNVNINRPASPGTRPGAGGGGEKWQHRPEHRQGVAYRDQGTRDKYAPTNRAAVDSRQANRGYDKPGAGTADRSAGRQSAQQERAAQDRTPDRSGSGAKSQNHALGGMDRGGQASRDSARGSQSMSSAKSHGGGSARPSGGGASRGGGGRGRR